MRTLNDRSEGGFNLIEVVIAPAVEEKAAVAPVGSPAAENETACVVPATSVVLVVVETEAPWVTALLPPFVRAKSKEEAKVL